MVKKFFVSLLLITVTTMTQHDLVFAESTYDDLVGKVSTKTMTNYLKIRGKECGSLADDYANRWLYAFKRQEYNNQANHEDAVRSL